MRYEVQGDERKIFSRMRYEVQGDERKYSVVWGMRYEVQGGMKYEVQGDERKIFSRMRYREVWGTRYREMREKYSVVWGMRCREMREKYSVGRQGHSYNCYLNWEQNVWNIEKSKYCRYGESPLSGQHVFSIFDENRFLLFFSSKNRSKTIFCSQLACCTKYLFALVCLLVIWLYDALSALEE